MSKYQVAIEGMSCNGCANTVEKKFSALEGVSQVKVDLDTNSAELDSDRVFTKKELNDVLDVTPFDVVEVEEA